MEEEENSKSYFQHPVTIKNPVEGATPEKLFNVEGLMMGMGGGWRDQNGNPLARLFPDYIYDFPTRSSTRDRVYSVFGPHHPFGVEFSSILHQISMANYQPQELGDSAQNPYPRDPIHAANVEPTSIHNQPTMESEDPSSSGVEPSYISHQPTMENPASCDVEQPRMEEPSSNPQGNDADSDIDWGQDEADIEKILGEYEGRYIEIMRDKDSLKLFKDLLAKCTTDQHLQIIVDDIANVSDSLIEAALTQQGASSIIALIRKARNTAHAASTLTQILSTQLVLLITHDEANSVIRNCFLYFGHDPNQILYDEVIDHFEELAIHKVGCMGVQVAIQKTEGETKTNLLNQIVDSAVNLANDQYGNHVVQAALDCGEIPASEGIVEKLGGHLVELAKKNKKGCHLVRKCMQVSRGAIVRVVEEILSTCEADLTQLTEYNAGKSVIQMALDKTKDDGLKHLYDSLVLLKPTLMKQR